MIKQIERYSQKLLLIIVVVSFAFYSALPLPCFAEDNSSTTVGASDSVGPHGITGPTSAPGPQGIVGHEVGTNTGTTSIQDGETIENISTENYQTGPSSENMNSIDQKTSTTIDQTDNQNTTNTTSADLDTGNSAMSNNTNASFSSTGDIDGNINIINTDETLSADSKNTVLNLDSHSLSGSLDIGTILQGEYSNQPLVSQSDLSNSLSGSDSINNNCLTNQSSLTIIENNNSKIQNTINIDANTGQNSINGNTFVTDFSTGDINLAINNLNLVGFLAPDAILDLNVINIVGNLCQDIIIPNLLNSDTGESSENFTDLSTGNQYRVEKNIDGIINNDISINANTGSNDFSNNSSIGKIITGGVNLNSGLNNLFVDHNPVLYVINILGKWFGVIKNLPNVLVNTLVSSNDEVSSEAISANEQNNQSGEKSNNLNALDLSTDVNIKSNDNRKINNKINISANTGRNKINNNTFVGEIKTGEINVLSSVTNLVSHFGTKIKKLRLCIINIFGNWDGNATSKKDTIASIEDSVSLINSGDETHAQIDQEINRSSLQNDRTTAKNNLAILAANEINDEIDNPDESLLSDYFADSNLLTQPTAGTGISYLFILLPGSVALGWLVVEFLRYRGFRRK